MSSRCVGLDCENGVGEKKLFYVPDANHFQRAAGLRCVGFNVSSARIRTGPRFVGESKTLDGQGERPASTQLIPR